MIRVNLAGKVGYFNGEDEAFGFALAQMRGMKDGELLNDYRPSVERVKNDWAHLRALNGKKLVVRDWILKSNTGVSVANYFMNFRFGLRVSERKTVLESFRDEKQLRRVFHKVIKLARRVNIGVSEFFELGRMVGGTQGLGNFMPAVAKAIYEEFCPIDGGNILDMSAGFGGRLVGCMASKRNYFYCGIDPSKEAFEGLIKIKDFLKCEGRISLLNKPFEDCDGDLEDGYFDFAFTSPPYFKKELYSLDENQSYRRYPAFRAWIEGFLEPMMRIAAKKVKAGGKLAVNIADVKIGKDVYNLEEEALKAGMGCGLEFIGKRRMEMSKMPGIKRKFKEEPILVFEKNNSQ
jgi:hypothetical protein